MAALQPILSQNQLSKLKEHKYSSANKSFLDPYMNVFWTWLVEKVPRSIHPNTMTVGGLVVNALTTLILVAYSSDAKTPVCKTVVVVFVFVVHFSGLTFLMSFFRLPVGRTLGVVWEFSYTRPWTRWTANMPGERTRAPRWGNYLITAVMHFLQVRCFSRLIDWFIYLLIDWLVAWLVAWLIDWLIDWSRSIRKSLQWIIV